MVTGAYFPEVSGGGTQCRAIVRELKIKVRFALLTTSTNPALPTSEHLDGVPLYRLPVDVRRMASKITATLMLAARFVRLHRRFDIIHVHGFSRKMIALSLLSWLFGKRILLTLQTAAHDEAQVVRTQGVLAYWAYRRADSVSGVSPRLEQAYLEADLPPTKFRLIPNAVDLDRFRPATPEERRALRSELGLAPHAPLILFIGYFSRDKRPDLLFEAWMRLVQDERPIPGLVFVGATKAGYYEIEQDMADRIRAEAERMGVSQHLRFVEITQEIEKYQRAVDVFVLPSAREAAPIALLESMASGLPCIATRLPGSTDVIIHHGVNGLLVSPDDPEGFSEAIRCVLRDPSRASELGSRARQTIANHYSIGRIAERYLETYRGLTAGLS